MDVFGEDDTEFFGEDFIKKKFNFLWLVRDDFQIWDVKREVLKPSYLRDLSFIVTLHPARQYGCLASTLNLRSTHDAAIKLTIHVFCNGVRCVTHDNVLHLFGNDNDHTYTAKFKARSRGPSEDNLLRIFILITHPVKRVPRDQTEDLEELSRDLESLHRYDRLQVGRLTCNEGFVEIHPFILLSRHTDFPVADFGIGSSVDFGMSLNYLRKFVRYLYTGRIDGMPDRDYGEDFRTALSVGHLDAYYLLAPEVYRREEHFPAHKRRINVFLGFRDRVNVSLDIHDRRYKRFYGYDNFSFELEVLPGHTTGTWLKYTVTSSSNLAFHLEVEIGVIKNDRYAYVHGERHTLLNNGDEGSSTHLLFLGARNVFGNLLIYGRIQLSITLTFRQDGPNVEIIHHQAGYADPRILLSFLAQCFWEGLREQIATDMYIASPQHEEIPCHKTMFRARLRNLQRFPNNVGLLTDESETIATQFSWQHLWCILEYMYAAEISNDLRSHIYEEVKLFAIAHNIEGLERFFNANDD
ncbi:hypothetical protein CDAR_123121 [Caerostris darwini]|uniref:BTB domain-containing protein n=1 Tax=Caerostris darwini TaxID=1538125 RepID=A0AAV4XAI5_9ARAC|nr:hypothetical protein CDAR_123121 [Caerostris darwini]